MAALQPPNGIFRFGVFELDVSVGELRKNGVRVKLQQQPFQVLLCLLEHAGNVVSREQLIRRLWPNGTVVEYEHSLGTAVNKIRQALGDSAGRPSYVETLPRRGYRFLVSVKGIARPAEERPPQLVALPPQPGTTISHYRILDKIGEGGMGVVYKAEDTRLDRLVALKFLSPHLLRDEKARGRFVREAKAAAALHHPSICPVFEIDEAAGQTFIAMAFLEGQLLSQKIEAGPLPLSQALAIAIQVAEGLGAAHDKGIVHRDIKPDNVMLLKGAAGRVSLMDFGLAQLAGSSSSLTREGAILGTIAYMSPEQAQSKVVDHRTDIWSLGTVLYEMVAGTPPFRGDHERSVVFSIISDDPQPLATVRPGAPPELQRIANRCLTKDPTERYQQMDALLTDLRSVPPEMELASARVAAPAKTAAAATTQAVRPAEPNQPLSFLALLLLGVVLVAAAIGMIRWLSPPIVQPTQYKYTQLTRDTGLTFQPTISPDGKLVAYASDRGGQGNLDIWVQHAAGGAPIQLTDADADDRWPSFSRDSNRIVFSRQGVERGIFVIPALGGHPTKIADEGLAPRFSPDGRWVSYHGPEALGFRPTPIYVVSTTGGLPRRLDTGVDLAAWPLWSPDGRYLLFSGKNEPRGGFGSWEWWVAPVEGGKAIPLGAREMFRRAGFTDGIRGARPFGRPHAWVPGQNLILFSARMGDSENLWQVRLSPSDWTFAGEPQRLTSGTGESTPSIALNGRIAFASFSFDADIWVLPIDASRALRRGQAKRLITGPTSDWYPTISADGKKLVYLSHERSGHPDIWLTNLETDDEQRLTATPQLESRALISPDGKHVAYSVVEDSDKRTLRWIQLTERTDRKLVDDIGNPMGWAPDSKRVVYYPAPPDPSSTVNVITGEKVRLVTHPDYAVHSVSFCPDGRWLSLKLLIEPLRVESLFVAPVEEGVAADRSQWIRITEGHHDGHNWWSPDGTVLYFLSLRDGYRCIYAQRVGPTTKEPVGSVIEVQHFHTSRQWLHPGGFGRALTADRLYFSVMEQAANIWLAEPQERR